MKIHLYDVFNIFLTSVAWNYRLDENKENY